MQSNFETASRELNEIRAEKNELDAGSNEISANRQRVEQEAQDAAGKLQRAQQSQEAKLNNVRAVKGAQFD